MTDIERDIDWLDDHMEDASDVTKERWQRLRARLTPDRERVAKAICADCEGDASLTFKGDARGNKYRWQDYLSAADAAINAMGEP